MVCRGGSGQAALPEKGIKALARTSRRSRSIVTGHRNVHSPMLASSGLWNPRSQVWRALRGFRTIPSWPLPITPRTVLSDAWRGSRDVVEVYCIRALCRREISSILRPCRGLNHLDGQPNISNLLPIGKSVKPQDF